MRLGRATAGPWALLRSGTRACGGLTGRTAFTGLPFRRPTSTSTTLTSTARAQSGGKSAPPPPPPNDGDNGHFLTFLRQGAQFLGLMWLVDRYGGYLSMTQGPSMMPTLNELGDMVFVDRFSVLSGVRPLERGDVIIADSPGKAESYQICKRVVALAGDVIRPHGRDTVIEIPVGHVWVEGDNPHNSVDSRAYGPLPVSLVRGRVVAKVWPPHQAGWMSQPQQQQLQQGEQEMLMVPSFPAYKPTSNSLMLQAMLDDPLITAHAKKVIATTRELQALSEGLQTVSEATVAPTMALGDSSHTASPAAPTAKDRVGQALLEAAAAASAAAPSSSSLSSSLAATRRVGRKIFDLSDD